VGSPIAGRDQAQIEGLIGFFINILALRLDLSGAPHLEGLVGRVREVALEAYAHQHLPFERLVDELGVERNLSHTPIVQVLLQLLADPLEDLELSGLSLHRLSGEGQTAKYDLVVNGMETRQGLEVTWRYNRDLFDRSTIRRLARHFEALLEAAFEAPTAPLAELPLLGTAERHQLLEWNDTTSRLDGGCLHHLVEAQVRRSPDAVAVTFEEDRLTYAQLDARAASLAAALQDLGAGVGHRVGVLAERSLELVVALLGVMKSGAAYVPLDPDLPEARLLGMVEDADLTAVVFQDRHRDLLTELGGVAALCLEKVAEEGRAPRAWASPEDPAYMIFTSGSTGRPKGAVNRHSGIVNRLRWMLAHFDLRPEDRVLQKTPFSFDVSVWEFFWPLVSGARLVMARPGGHKDTAYLAEVIAREGVTTLHFVPSMLAVFLEEPAIRRLTTPRWVFASGEALTTDLERRFFETFPDLELHNLYGPTEAAVEVTWWACRSGSRRSSVPIGRPIANTRLEILDRSFHQVPIGVAGELHLGGVQVCNGYWGRPALTADRFVPDPRSPRPGARLYKTGDLTRFSPEGLVEFLGRTDHQVKVRGFRIELGEIEAALLGQEGVRETVVVALPGAGGDSQLVAYLVASGSTGRERVEGLRRALGTHLPEYMVPAAFVFLEAMPLTPSGKVDRRSLPDPEWSPGEEVAPRTPLEAALAELWRDVLEGVELGVTDNFFRVGGNSIRGAILVNRLQETLGETLHVVTIFDAPTIAQLADFLLARFPAAVARTWGEEALLPAGDGPGEAAAPEPEEAHGPIEAHAEEPGVPQPLSFAQERLWFIEQLEPGRSTYHIPAAFRVEGPLDVPALQRSAAEVVARHATLRTRFVARDGDPAQVIESFGGFPVP
ncbi:MAG: amino acid adenylation domain-containing protein, partial [Acidobacteria bacterium]|nr:amino acid adenylation domain-containing protein [Acidobacteriota bacterium]